MAPDDSSVEDDPRVSTAEMARIGASPSVPFGRPGRPMDRRSPFYFGFLGTLGALVAVGLSKSLTHVAAVLVVILMSSFIAVGLDPVVRSLVRRGLRRTVAVAIVIMGFLLALGVIALIVIPPLVQQGQTFLSNAPGAMRSLDTSSAPIPTLLRHYHLVDKIKANSTPARLSQYASQSASGFLTVGKALLGFTFTALTVLILTLYMLANLPGIKRSAYRLLPASRRPRAQLLTEDILDRIGGYVLGNVATSVIASALSFIALFAIRVPYALPVALLVGVLDIVPLVGGLIAVVLSVGIAALHGLPTALATLVVMTLLRQLEDYWIQPRVMKRTVNVPPAATLVAALIGGAVLGVIGVLLSVPAAAAIQLISREVFLPRQEAA